MRRHWINAINVLAPSLVFMALANVAHAQKAPPELAKFFDYTKAATVPATGGNVVRKAKCCDVTEWKLAPNSDALSDEIELTVIAPLKKGKHPTVLWLHREGQEVKRASFVQEAEALAASGIASILVELPFKQPYFARGNSTAGDADSIVAAVVDSRRTLDWAASRPEFNVEKVAVVGQHYGAWAGTLLAAIDPRVDALLLMSPPGKPSGWLQVTDQPKAKRFRDAFDKTEWITYLAAIEPLDPEKWIQYAAPAKVYFQFASGDEWVQTLEQVDLFRAALQPKTRQMFDSDELLNEEARKDRGLWLKKVLLGK